MLRVGLTLALAATANALVASPRLPVAVPLTAAHSPAVRAAAAPQMALGFGGGGGRRSFIRSIRMRAPSPRFPNFGLGKGGSRAGGIIGSDGGDGGDGAEATPAPDDGESGGNGGLAGVWKRYNELLDEKPLLMKALTSFTGFALGDILAQKFITKGPFDWPRLFRLSTFGLLVHGTTSHWFYGMLDGKIPGTSAKVVFSKVFIDQVLWNPIFGIMFFSYVALLELKGLGFVIEKTKKELITSVTGSWTVWPVAHAINFRFIPSSQRVLYINSIQIGYNCFLSLISNRD